MRVCVVLEIVFCLNVQKSWDHDTCLLAAVPDDFDRGRQDGVKDKRCQHHQHQLPHPGHPNPGCFLSKKERNKLAHALNGNGGTRKNSRDRRPRDDTRDRDEDRPNKEERRMAKLEKEKLDSLDEIEEERQRLEQQKTAMEQQTQTRKPALEIPLPGSRCSHNSRKPANPQNPQTRKPANPVTLLRSERSREAISEQ